LGGYAFADVFAHCEKKGFTTEVLELSRGEQGGIKTRSWKHGTLRLWFAEERGRVHRLVRLSPLIGATPAKTFFRALRTFAGVGAGRRNSSGPKKI